MSRLGNTRLSRPARLVPALTLALLAAACGGASSSKSSAPTATLRVGFIQPAGQIAGPEGWEAHLGKLDGEVKAAGFGKVVFSSFKNGPDLTAALTGGSLDLGELGDTPALTAKAAGIDTRLINQTVTDQDAWLVTKKGGPTSISALKGQTVATQLGSYMYRYLLALLAQNHLTGQVKVTNIYTAGARAALQSGAVAAYAAPAGQLTSLLTTAGFPVIDKASTQHPELLASGVTVVTAKALAAHPSLPKVWNAARDTGIADIKANATAYYAFASTATSTPVAVIQAVAPVTAYNPTPLTTAGLAELQATQSFLTSKKLQSKPVDLTSWQAS